MRQTWNDPVNQAYFMNAILAHRVDAPGNYAPLYLQALRRLPNNLALTAQAGRSEIKCKVDGNFSIRDLLAIRDLIK